MLRREREVREVTLEEISAATLIGVRYLEALEDERWDDLPGDVYVRNYLRAYASHLGLDPDRLITEYVYRRQRDGGLRDGRLRRSDGEAPSHPAERGATAVLERALQRVRERVPGRRDPGALVATAVVAAVVLTLLWWWLW